MNQSRKTRWASPGSDVPAATRGRQVREKALNETRRALILDAARSAFFELGLDGASLREIAKRAGYTPGAIYSYFANLEEIYGALLAESLERLDQAVRSAETDENQVGDRTVVLACLRAKAMAFYRYYRDHPKELDLGFYLFNGTRPRGLTPAIDQRLNERLLAALRPVEQLLAKLGLPEDEAVVETAAVFAHIVGVLVLNNTGRIRLFGQSPDALFERYLDSVVARFST